MTTVPVDTLLSLAERVEAATGPDRELDAKIFRAVGTIAEEHCRDWCRMDGRTDLTRDHYIAAWAPPYSHSLDAAMTLVPEGSSIHLHLIPYLSTQVEVGIGKVATAATPALALTAASLKARAGAK